MLTPPRALCAPPLTQEGRTAKTVSVVFGSVSTVKFLFSSLSLSLFLFPFLFLFLFLSLFLFLFLSLFLPVAFYPLFGEEGGVPERHEGSSQLHKCLVVDFVFAVGGGPRWARYEKGCFLYIRYLTSACLRHDFYVMPSSEALQKTTFFMPFGGSFSLGYLFFWPSKRKGTTLVFF